MSQNKSYSHELTYLPTSVHKDARTLESIFHRIQVAMQRPMLINLTLYSSYIHIILYLIHVLETQLTLGVDYLTQPSPFIWALDRL